MTAIPFRMVGGFPGEVTRTHPASIYSRLNDPTNPVPAIGLFCMYNGAANDVRAVASGDANASAIQVAGIVARPFPFQAPTAPQPFGGAPYGNTAPPSQVIDVLLSGSILVPTVGTPHLGDPVYMWCAAASGSHVQGAAEASATGGSTALVANAFFNSGPDSQGLCEIALFAGP